MKNEHDDEREIQQALRRYHVADPPASLRERIVDAAATGPAAAVRPRITFWLAAAAAMLVALLFHQQATSTFTALGRDRAAHDAAMREATIEQLTTLLGGGELARSAAVRWVAASEAVTDTAEQVAIGLEMTWIR